MFDRKRSFGPQEHSDIDMQPGELDISFKEEQQVSDMNDFDESPKQNEGLSFMAEMELDNNVEDSDKK